MTSHDEWPALFLDLGDYPAGQGFSDLRYTSEPSHFDGDVHGFDSAVCSSVNEAYSGPEDSAISYDGFNTSIAQFDGSARLGQTGFAFDSYEQPFNGIHLRRSWSPSPRMLKKEPGMTRSASSTETECSNEDDQQRHVCQECNKLFRNLQELDQHAKRTPHRAWRCAEPFCEKTYARRDTFLRHRATHKDKSHSCPVCPRLNKQKVFKRKDHLKEHIRNCHSKSIESADVESVRSSGGNVNVTSTGPGGRYDTGAFVFKGEGRKHVMERVVESLHALMGDDKENILGELGDSLNTLSGPDMQTVASSMAKAALEKSREKTIRKLNC